jgi:hypothetical protein
MREGTYQAQGRHFVSVDDKWSTGWFVATTDNPVADSLEDVTLDDLRQVQGSSDDLVGVWYDKRGGKAYVDRVLYVQHGQLAMALATHFKQRSVYWITSQMVLPVLQTPWEALGLRP